MEPVVLGMLAGYGIAIPVGAIAVLIVQTGIRCGFRCALSAGSGAATADLAYAVLAVSGGAALSSAIGSIQQPLRWGSGLLLAAIAVTGLIRARRQPAVTEMRTTARGQYAGTYMRFLGLTIVNPLTVVYFSAIVLGSGVAGSLTPGEGVMFAAGAFAASLSWQALLAAIGGAAGTRLPDRFHTFASTGGHLLVLVMAALIVIR